MTTTKKQSGIVLNRERLIEAAKELNEVCGVKPEINTKETPEELKLQIKEAIRDCVESGDEFTKETQAVIDELSDGQEKEEELTLEEQIDAAPKRKDLVEIVKANKEFKGIRGKLPSYKSADELRDAMHDELDELKEKEEKKDNTPKKVEIEKSAKASQKEKEIQKPPRQKPQGNITRITALAIIMKDNPNMVREEVIDAANKLYGKVNPGPPNNSEMIRQYRQVIQVLEIFKLK